MTAPLPRRALALTALLLLGACGDRAPLPVVSDAQARPPASRVMVLAGDTLVIDGKHIELANAVAPQGIPDARCWAEALAAKQTVQYVKSLLRDSRTMKVIPTGEVDNYGRTLAHVKLDGLDLGQTLYDNGAAAQPLRGSFRWCEPVSRELDGAPRWSSLSEPGRNY
jgi:endonuclease YncB( thermonuclease family)